MGRLNLNRKLTRDESDESEASSVCSERSFDSYRRNDVSFIIEHPLELHLIRGFFFFFCKLSLDRGMGPGIS